jgi:hypothetical protein
MVHDDFEPIERMSVGMRVYWTLVTALSAVCLYLIVVCATPRGPVGY